MSKHPVLDSGRTIDLIESSASDHGQDRIAAGPRMTEVGHPSRDELRMAAEELRAIAGRLDTLVDLFPARRPESVSASSTTAGPSRRPDPHSEHWFVTDWSLGPPRGAGGRRYSETGLAP